MSFQLVLSSDGHATFAAVVYKDPHVVENLQEQVQVGFNAGDRTRGANIFGTNAVDYGTLEPVNIFRIDGKYIAEYWPLHLKDLQT